MKREWLAMAAAGTMLAAVSGVTIAATTEPPKPNDFLTQEKADQWRATKLSGVAIYGTDKKKIGSINDVLVGHDGKAQYIVLAIGGFLGIGQKSVAVPFDAITFTDKPLEPEPAPAAPAAGAPTAPGGMGASTAAAPPPPPPIAYPDHGTLSTTKEELQKAPDFRFAQ